MWKTAFLFCPVLALAAGCKRAAPQPRYCGQDLSGVWVNSSDPTYAYRLEDQGESVRGKFFHRLPDGGEAAPEPGDDPKRSGKIDAELSFIRHRGEVVH